MRSTIDGAQTLDSTIPSGEACSVEDADVVDGNEVMDGEDTVNETPDANTEDKSRSSGGGAMGAAMFSLLLMWMVITQFLRRKSIYQSSSE